MTVTIVQLDGTQFFQRIGQALWMGASFKSILNRKSARSNTLMLPSFKNRRRINKFAT